MRLSLNSFLLFAKSNSFPTLVDLIFLLILSIHVTLILSYPYIFTFILIRSLSFPQMRWLLSMTSLQEQDKELSTHTTEDGLPQPIRRRPEYRLTRRATPGSPPRLARVDQAQE